MRHWALRMEHASVPAITVDLHRCVVRALDGREIAFSVPAERRDALLKGLDEIDVILSMESDIAAFQQRERVARPWLYPEPR